MRFLRPDLGQWWLVLPVIVACWTLHYRYTRRLLRMESTAPRFRELSRRSTRMRSLATLVAGVTAAAALIFSAMRPQAVLERRTPEFERQDLIVMLDRSVSMRARDIAPSRSSRATLEIRNFLRDKPDAIDRVGLVGFADASVILSYLTSDIESIFFYLDSVDDNSKPLFGTNIGAAVRSAMEIARKDDRPTRKIYLLVSDGEDYGNELRKALADFRAAGNRLHCIGIGSDEDVPIPMPTADGSEALLRADDGRLVKAKFAETTLKSIAEGTGGRYERSSTGNEMARALAGIVSGERRLLGWRTTRDYRDLYPAGLAVAAVAGAALLLIL